MPPSHGDSASAIGRTSLYPAITHPHKRHALLVDMLRSLAEQGDRDTALVLIGGLGAAEPELQRAIADAGVADRVVRPGRVSDARRATH